LYLINLSLIPQIDKKMIKTLYLMTKAPFQS